MRPELTIVHRWGAARYRDAGGAAALTLIPTQEPISSIG